MVKQSKKKKSSLSTRSLIEARLESRTGSTVIGWREWMTLPQLGIPAIKVKADTGARTSCLHALNIEPYVESSVLHVRFLVPPIQELNAYSIACCAPVVDRRKVRDSGGHTELRYVVQTGLEFNGREREIEITLTHRKNMRFRMLLGRSALAPDLIVDANASYRFGRANLAQCYPGQTSSRTPGT